MVAFLKFAYFQNGGKRVKLKQKAAYLSKYCFDFDDVYIKLYVFWGADAIYEVPVQVRGHADVVYDKVKVILANKVKNDRFKQIWAILDIW